MKLGVDTGSLVNWIYSSNEGKEVKIEIGMPVTKLYWTDRDVYVVTDIDDKYITIAEAKTVMKGGIYDGYKTPVRDENGNIEYYNDSKLYVRKFRNRWNAYDKVSGTRYGKVNLIFGVADGYRDPCF